MTIREKLRAYLEDHPEGAPVAELTALILSGRRGDPELDDRIARHLIGNDPAFAYDPLHQRWSLAEQTSLRMPIEQASYVVVDIETIGGRPGPGQIIEIGAYKTVGPRIVDSFETLVRPRVQVPRFITRMTSITNEMVAEAAPIDSVLPRFRDFMGDSVMVAHNAQFDFAFLSHEFRRLFGYPIANPVLCTLRLARRLLPSMRRRGLDALAEYFGLSTAGRHRGLGDARMAAELLAIFIEMLGAMGIRRLDLALDYQQVGAGGRRIERHVPSEVIADLPHVPGVYLMYNERGDLLYVGKARDLRRRVGSYFSGGVTLAPKVIELVRHVWNIRTIAARSTLDAALLEARLIREQKPPYNRQLKRAPQAYFVKIDLTDAFARLMVASRLSARRDLLQLGPYFGRRHPRQAVEALSRHLGLRTCAGRLTPDAAVSPCIYGQMGRCSAPCNASIGEGDYQERLRRARDFLRGRSGPLLNDLMAARDQAARAMRFGEAARYQRDLDSLQFLVRRERRLSQAVQENNLVIIGGGIAFVILSGRLAARIELDGDNSAAQVAACVNANYVRYRARSVAKDELEPMLIVARWLRERRPDDGRLIFLSGPFVPLEALQAAGDPPPTQAAAP